MKPSIFAAILLLPALAAAVRPARTEERIELSGRAGVAAPFLYDAARDPVASVILFTGGDGDLEHGGPSFLLRARKRFVAAHINVAVPDTPSDHPGGFGPLFRLNGDHIEDLAQIVTFFKLKSAAPIWAIGISNGTISAANAAAELGPHAIAGLVLLSSVWLGGLADVPVDRIAAPVLVIDDRSDACPASPFALARQNLVRFTAAPAKTFVAIAGRPHVSEPCGALSPHDFYGVETATVRTIIAFIRAHL